MLFSTIGAVAMVAPAVVLSAFIRNKYFRMLAVVALVYPFGEWLQYMRLGPGWIRWHLSDVGFTSSVGLLISVFLFTGSFFRSTHLAEKFPTQLLVGVSIAFTVAVAHETINFLIHDKPDPAHPVSRGDWVDMIIFFLSFGLNYWLIIKMKQSWHKV